MDDIHPEPEDHGAFVARFIEVWAAPSLDGLAELLEPDVRLVAPLTAETHTQAEAIDEFRRIFTLLPDLRGSVHRWAGRGDHVFIEFELSGTLGRRRITWPVVDSITLRNGRVAERVSYQDPTPLVAALARTPSAWRRAWQAGLGPAPLRRLARRRR